jgi:hypothetical protein
LRFCPFWGKQKVADHAIDSTWHGDAELGKASSAGAMRYQKGMSSARIESQCWWANAPKPFKNEPQNRGAAGVPPAVFDKPITI